MKIIMITFKDEKEFFLGTEKLSQYLKSTDEDEYCGAWGKIKFNRNECLMAISNTINYFIEKQIDVNYVMPSDLAELPGAVKLFKSTWIDYSIAARAYTSYYVCLAPFYKEYLASSDEKNNICSFRIIL